MGLFRTVSEIGSDFSQKLQNFPTPVYYAPPLMVTDFPLELGIGARSQKLEWYGNRKVEKVLR